MLYLAIKSLLSGIIIMVISETAKRSPVLGGLVASLPFISILGILWLWKDTADIELVAAHAQATFWFVLPSLPFFLVFPMLLRHGAAFWLALGVSCALTICLYAVTFWILPKIGIRF